MSLTRLSGRISSGAAPPSRPLSQGVTFFETSRGSNTSSKLEHFGFILGSPGPQKTRFSCGRCCIFRKIEPKSLPEASRDLPELTLALLGLILPLLGVIWSLLGFILDLLGLILNLLGRSWGSPGALWGASGELLGPPRASKIAPGGSPGGPPHQSLILAPFWELFWLDFGTPRTSKNMVFVWKVLHFSKNRGVRKNRRNWSDCKQGALDFQIAGGRRVGAGGRGFRGVYLR